MVEDHDAAANPSTKLTSSDSVSVNASRKITRAGVASLTAIAYGIVFYGILSAKSLRPIADDYTIAAASLQGPLNAIQHYWNFWSGDLVAWMSNVILVGLPLIGLPWGIASAVPFAVSLALVVAVALTLITSRVSLTRGASQRSTWRAVLIFAGPIALAWWAYWWGPQAFGTGGSREVSLAAGITMWQTLNAQYVVPIAIAVGAYCLVETRMNLSRVVILGYGVLGLFIGFTGPVMAVATLVFVPILGLLCVLIGHPLGKSKRNSWVLLWGGGIRRNIHRTQRPWC